MAENPFSALPSVQELLKEPSLFESGLPRWSRLEGARAAVEEGRERIRQGEAIPSLGLIAAGALEHAKVLARPSLRPLVNATGIVIHTNLGRAPLSQRALDHVLAVGRGYCNLEYDIDSGRRGSRRVHARDALRRLTGAEDALIVNNNSAAVLLVLTAFARGKEVIVSRGELVEIGGSFRIPDIMEAGGARLREVGTTNRTRIADYKAAVGESTGLILKVHPSNFQVQGFTESTTRQELASLGAESGVPVVEDLGSGCINRGQRGSGLGFVAGREEPDLAEVVASGLDLITLSGDKLIGGPQVGIILGKAAKIQALAAHPMARALRVGKLTLAALEATLASYLEGEAGHAVPVVRALGRRPESLRSEALALKTTLVSGLPGLPGKATLSLIEGEGRSGGGSLPGAALATTLVALRPLGGGESQWAEALRRSDPGVICRIKDGALLFDPRTLLPGDDVHILKALRGCLSSI